MTDRKPTNPHRIRIIPEDGSAPFYATWEYADGAVTQGTPLNKANLLSDETAALLGMASADATPNTALNKLGRRMGAVTVSLRAANWSGSSAPYTQTVQVAGMASTWIPGIPTVLVASGTASSTVQSAQEALGYISMCTSNTGNLVFTCLEDKPSVDLTLRVPGVMGISESV